MKLVKQANLFLPDGRRRDRIFEIDLCEVGPDQHVVNFRYGRRGKTLKDGSKTIVAVPRREAEAVFAKLLSKKLKEGYQPEGEPPRPAPDEAPARRRSSQRPPDPRAEAILERLRRPRALGDQRLDRIIWRAGELGLSEAEPLLLDLIDGRGADNLERRQYCVAWALGRSGSVRATGKLFSLGRTSQSRAVRLIAAEAVRRLAEGRDKDKLIADIIDSLPAGLSELARRGPAEALRQALQTAYSSDPAAATAISSAYLIDNEHTRPVVLHFARRVPLSGYHFPRLRELYKAAEFRRDGELFGLLAYRFDSPAEGYGRKWGSFDRDKSATQRYFRRRTWRTLRRLGELGDGDYVKMAVGVLLPFTDDDGGSPRRGSYSYYDRASRRYRSREVHWDRFARAWAFNGILYGQSPRYEADKTGQAWRCQDGYRPGQPPPSRREEAFPELWEQAPEGLLHLLDESRCEPVHVFACKALRACPRFLRELGVEVIALLLDRPYACTAELGFDLARQAYDPARPSRQLLLAVAECCHAPARLWLHGVIERQQAELLTDSELLATLASSRHEDNRSFARTILGRAVLTDRTARVLLGRLVAVLQGLGEGDESRAEDVVETLAKCFAGQLGELSLSIVRDLLRHPLAEVQRLAAEILLAPGRTAEPPEDVLVALLDSEHEPLRQAGSRLLGRLSDEQLGERIELLIALSTHKLADLRAGMQPLVVRLATHSTLLAERFVAAALPALCRQADDGVHRDLLQLITRDAFARALRTVSAEQIWRLLRSRYPHAQELGGLLLKDNLEPEDLELSQIVKLADHEIRSIREASWSMCERSLPRLKGDMAGAVRLFDSRWEDSRQRAMALFTAHFTPEDFTPAILVSICDSVREDVQAFGRRLITQCFAEEHGQEYLLKLSEHPSPALQLFATNYLERYAAGNLERLIELGPYFLSVLSRVNTGRIAKARIIGFLEQQALRSEDFATVVGELLSRQSVTIAITHKARIIEAMVKIHLAFPNVPLPIKVKPVEVRSGV